MGYRYIGSKARIVDEIMEYLGKPHSGSGRFIDAFSGTGVVAEKAALLGWKIHINDMMECAKVMSESRLISMQEAKFEALGGYESTIKILNNLDGIEGFIYTEYSPKSSVFCGIERKYFTENNAKKIDHVIKQIHEWKKEKVISEKEFTLLLSDVISAVNRIANIAGTYGCFMSKWTNQALGDFQLECSILINQPIDYIASVLDVFEIESEENDVIYFDPPYTKRQYASYYHILETIVCGDAPIVEGVSGLRPWRDKASVFCYKVKALKALSQLILQQKAKRVLLSYSNDGHINLEDLVQELQPYGTVELIEVGTIGRYRPNTVAGINRKEVKEYLIDYRRNL